MRRSMYVVVLAAAWAVPSAGAAAPPAAAPSPVATSPDVVAVIAGEPFTAAQLEEVAGPRLFQLRSQQYQAQRQILDDAIATRLLEREAAQRKITLDELV